MSVGLGFWALGVEAWELSCEMGLRRLHVQCRLRGLGCRASILGVYRRFWFVHYIFEVKAPMFCGLLVSRLQTFLILLLRWIKGALCGITT